MPSITALLHTQNDALRLGRALETLYACDEVLIVDHASRDHTVRVALDYGARVIQAKPELSAQDYAALARSEWILSMGACESLAESLTASLYEWKSGTPDEDRAPAFSVVVREETVNGWSEIPTTQTRLVPRDWQAWNGKYPAYVPSAIVLKGELLRFAFP